jgi:hypothetical protein
MGRILPVRGCAQTTPQKRRRVTIHLSLNHDPLDFVEADLVAPTIAELRRARRGMGSPAATSTGRTGDLIATSWRESGMVRLKSSRLQGP